MKNFFRWLFRLFRALFQNYARKPITVLEAPEAATTSGRAKNKKARKAYAVRRGNKNQPFTRAEIKAYFEKHPRTVLIIRSVRAISPTGIDLVPNRRERRAKNRIERCS